MRSGRSTPLAGAVLLLVLAGCLVQAAAAAAAIDIETLTNGDQADTPPGPSITVGSPVLWTCVVSYTYDRGVAVSAPQTALAPGESMTCTASGTAVAGQYANVATVTASPPAGPDVSASDPSHYYCIVPLVAGRNTVRVETGSAGSFNLDYLEFATGPRP